MNNAQTMQHILTNIITANNLYGRSFTYGVALRLVMQNQLLYDGLGDVVEDMLHAVYGNVLVAMRSAGMRVDLFSLAEVIDLSVLDEIARTIIGEDEDA